MENKQQIMKGGSGICGKNLLPRKLDPHFTNLVNDVGLEGDGEEAVPHGPEAVAVDVAAAPPSLFPVLPAPVLAVVVVRHVPLQRGRVGRRRRHDFCREEGK